MTMPRERTRALINTWDFLFEVAKGKNQYSADAALILRHFPGPAEVLSIASGKVDMLDALVAEQDCEQRYAVRTSSPQ